MVPPPMGLMKTAEALTWCLLAGVWTGTLAVEAFPASHGNARRSTDVAAELCDRVSDLEHCVHPDPFTGDSLTPSERSLAVSKITTRAYSLVTEYRNCKEHEEVVQGRRKPIPVSEEP